MTATVIRHRVTPNGFDIVVTELVPFVARYQRYATDQYGRTVLNEQHTYSTEEGAVALWEADA